MLTKQNNFSVSRRGGAIRISIAFGREETGSLVLIPGRRGGSISSSSARPLPTPRPHIWPALVYNVHLNSRDVATHDAAAVAVISKDPLLR